MEETVVFVSVNSKISIQEQVAAIKVYAKKKRIKLINPSYIALEKQNSKEEEMANVKVLREVLKGTCKTIIVYNYECLGDDPAFWKYYVKSKGFHVIQAVPQASSSADMLIEYICEAFINFTNEIDKQIA